MAQTKNTFIKSRMNKDLDERLVPNGEYRDALNIEVSQSEDSDVGTLSTSLGNLKLTDFGLTDNCEAKIIGFFADEKDKDIYVFITNFIDTSPSKLDLFPSDDAICQIWKRNIETNLNTKLAEGKFLNFSLTHEILNINLLEDLLFWTDNRNQPRKINVLKANPGNEANPTYYTNEDQVSVAKYYPFEPIELLNDYVVDYSVTSNGGGVPGTPAPYFDLLDEIVPTTASTGVGVGLTVKITSASSATTGNLVAVEIINQGIGYQNGDIINIAPKSGSAQITLVVELQSTMKDKCSEFLPETTTGEVTATSLTITSGTGFSFQSSPNSAVNFVGCLVKFVNSAGQDLTPKGAICTSVGFVGVAIFQVEWKDTPNTVTLDVGSVVTFGVNPDYDANWPGDCEFLKDKFVRFAYRFKFSDNEYSLISPFTQACFVPNQNGYFLSESRDDINGGPKQIITDAELAYESTDLKFFENLVNSVDLKIPAPNYLNSANNYFSNLTSEMHVKEIDIIYKDDNENVLKILDTITKESFENVDYPYIIYDYQSRSPIRVLPEDEITRVSDRVPLRALAQEVSGNRIIYGNYTDGHTSNNTLNYEIAAAEKVQITTPESGVINPNIKKEYQNHTLKQNRNYQVGVVLSDRYGRQSDVILSSLDNSKTTVLGESYRGSTIFHPFYSANPGLIDGVTTWAGDSLKVQFNSVIPETTGKFGYPGLFKDYEPPTLSNLQSTGGYTGPGATGATTTGGSGTGLTVDYVTFKPTGTSYIVSATINNPGVGYTNGDVITISGSSGNPATFIYNTNVFPNLTGWYSYKIVVKQQEQDYYNVYLPGIVNGAINEDGVDSTTKATVSLFGDNINKIPKDLFDVGPSQTNYRSDTKLSLRVQNVNTIFNSSQQFYPGTNVENVVSLSELTDLGISLDRIGAEVSTGGTPPAAIEISAANDKIQSGMSVVVVGSNGVPVIPLSEGAYVFRYYINNSNKPLVEIRGTTTAIPANSIITFGPAGIIYNSNNNPIVGILSTSKTIGVAEEDNFSVKLAVAETQPVKSLLDIYYETTTAGLIDSLNSAIKAGTPVTLPFGISPVSFSLTEAQTGPVICTNTFQPLSGLNTDIIDPNTTGSLIRVVDGNGSNRTNEFNLSMSNSGQATISTNKAVGSGFFVSDNPNKTNFTFDVKLTNSGIDVFKSFTGSIENIRPSYVNPSPIPSNYSISKNGGVITDAYKAINGSGDASLNKNDLKWELISVVPIAGQNRPFSPTIQAQDPDGNFVEIGPGAASSWPTVILPENSTPVENYQIVLQENYINNSFIRIIKEDLSGQSNIEINNDGVKIVVRDLNTESIAPFEIDPDGDPTFLQSISNFFGNDANLDPFNVSIDVSLAVYFITWRVKLRVVDGAGLAGDEIVLDITQQ